MENTFVHLKCHSEYSIVDGMANVEALVTRAKQQKMWALGLTDWHNVFGLVKFYQSACQAGIKPIMGADFMFKLPDDSQKQALITLLCQNAQGYAHLTQLITLAYTEGQQSQMPLLEWPWIERYAQGLIALSGGAYGDVGLALLAHQTTLAQSRLERWVSCFPKRFYLELQRTQRREEEPCIQQSLQLSKQYQLPVVATNDVRFLESEDFEAHKARVCIQKSCTLADKKHTGHYSHQQYLKSGEEIEALFQDIPEAITNSIEIAKRCTFEMSLGQVHLPQFPTPFGTTVNDYLKMQAQNGLEKRLGQVPSTYQKRLDEELTVIIGMGFPGYFLIVADFINWAKAQGIPVGPGRGSGAGSLVAYALGITDPDPLAHELLFERFLNKERISMPDFDIDFCMEGRDAVIDYVTQRYGTHCVSQIITYGTMAAKAVVRDVGRVLGMPYGMVDKVAKLIPFELGMTLDKAMQMEKILKQRYEQEEAVRTLWDLAKKLEGVVRNAGKHAGGVVIAPTQLTDFVPLYCEPGSAQKVTQFDKDDIEAVGLVKFDFLGLRTLTIIKTALNAINQKRGLDKQTAVDIQTISLNDSKTFSLLKSCQTAAVFQLESRGMRDLIRRLQPDCFDDITALVALFRPGPLQSGMVDDFINRKHGRSRVIYWHPALEPILKSTYGVILYQEQVMQIAQVLAGYSLGSADILRRAMGKKKPEEMARQRQVFLQGALENAIEETLAHTIFDLMEKFAGYGFNKSHSVAYALIAYQTAWLKAHYPAEFMSAVMSSDMDNTDKVVGFYQECQRMQLQINPPDINYSDYNFSVNAQGEIDYGLGAIKGVGQSVAESLVLERKGNGPYRDFLDFCVRLGNKKLNRRTVEALIYAGAMDNLEKNRKRLIASFERAIQYAEQQHKNAQRKQNDLFSGTLCPPPSLVSATETDLNWSEQQKLQQEKAVLGMYLTGHPLEAYSQELKAFSTSSIANCRAQENQKQVIIGIIANIRIINTQSGRQMGILVVEDLSAQMEVTLFQSLLERSRELLVKDHIVVIEGEVRKDTFTQGVRMVADRLSLLKEKRAQKARYLKIFLNQQQLKRALKPLREAITPYIGGPCALVIAYENEKACAQLKLGDDWQVSVCDALLDALNALSNQKVQVVY